MVTKIWAARAIECLRESLEPVPHELNELDWKLGLSAQKDRLTQHLIAFANYPNGGFLAYGIRDTDGVVEGIDKQRIDAALNTLANLGRDAIEPPLALDHAVIEYSGQAVLLIYVPEQNNKPVHKRGRPIDETWLRSGGTTRAASRQEVGGLMLNSTAPRWEELRASPFDRYDTGVAQ